MQRIVHLIFWMGGVIVPRISQPVLETLLPSLEAADSRSWLAILDFEKDLATGLLSTEEFGRRVVEVTRGRMTLRDLATRISNDLSPTDGIIPLLDELFEKYPLGLVSDFPRLWLSRLLEKSGLSRRFPEASITILPECGLATLSPGPLFDLLVARGTVVPGRTLWVDHDSHRTSAAIRRGIDAAIFVDTPRLRRDLVLWTLVPKE